ncbi:MAG: ABC transporter permease [Acidimicrobiales bacterium]
MLRAVGTRLLVALGMTLAVSALLFATVELLPGDAAVAILGANATPERVEALQTELRLDDPAVVRYLRWIGGIVTGDLGNSIVSGRPAWSVIATPARNSLVLGTGAVLAMAITALGVGVSAGRRPGAGVDRALSAAASLTASTPDFVIGTVLIIVAASWLEVLPAVSLVKVGEAPWEDPAILVLPILTLALVGGGYGARLIRAIVADAAGSPHVEAAELAGVEPRRVVTRHLLPSVFGPIAQVLASLVPYALGGTIVVERLFGYPGLGSLFTSQLAARDVVIVEAVGLLVAVVAIAALLVADTVDVVADPRNRRSVPARTS